MIALVFVDTNVLVYRHDSSHPAKQSRANDWITLLVRRRSARISFQVLQELYATLTRKMKPKPPDQDMRVEQRRHAPRLSQYSSGTAGSTMSPATMTVPLSSNCGYSAE